MAEKYFSEETPATVKQKKFVKNLAKTGEIGKSAKLVGYEKTYGSKLMRSSKILTLLHQELEKQGVTDVRVVGKIKDGLNAYYVKKDGGKKYKDFHAIHKYLDMVFKLRGDYAPEKHQVERKEITIVITPEVLKGLKDARAITDEELKTIEQEALGHEENNGTKEDI